MLCVDAGLEGWPPQNASTRRGYRSQFFLVLNDCQQITDFSSVLLCSAIKSASMKRLCLIVLLVVVGFAVPSACQTETLFSGEGLLNACTAHEQPDGSMYRSGLCMGFIVGIVSEHDIWLSEVPTAHGSLHFCIPPDVSNGQLVKVVKKYLEDNPGKLHLRVEFLVQKALSQAFPCK